ncbi:MAG: DNA-3-methyladenine glycosylase I [Trueperaceae bacterium]|nr:DNA-3-methyladenine glycosylase I [Trueperaceae bacterium]
MNRCGWVTQDPLYISYHDTEWGVPVYDDQKLFEFLLLESFQAGLSWITILKKRENFRAAFDNFAVETIANYGEAKTQELLQNAGIIRNKLKIAAAISNARAFIALQEKHGSFATYSWAFVGGKPKINHWKSLAQVPATTKESDALSKDLKKQGLKFVGSTVVYSHMQATGMVMDHTEECFRFKDLS